MPLRSLNCAHDYHGLCVDDDCDCECHLGDQPTKTLTLDLGPEYDEVFLRMFGTVTPVLRLNREDGRRLVNLLRDLEEIIGLLTKPLEREPIPPEANPSQ